MVQPEIDEIPSRVVLDERIAPQRIEDLHYNILKGAEDILMYKFPSTSYSSSQISFNITSPNLQAALDRKVILSMQCQFNISTANRTTPMFTPGTWTPGSSITGSGPYTVSESNKPLGGYAALRSDCPLQKRCSNISVQINTQSINYSAMDILECLSRYTSDYSYSNRSLSSLGFRDNYQSYSIGNADSVNNNPLGGYGQSSSNFSGRGVAFTSLVITNTDNNNSQLIIGWDEPIFVPPFIQSLNDVGGLMGLEKFSLSFTPTQLQNMLSLDLYAIAGAGNPSVNNVNVTASINATGVAPPTLTTYWLYSSASAEQYFLKNRYPITLFNQYITTSAMVAAAAVPLVPISTQTQAVTLPSIPSNLWVYVQETKAQKAYPWATDTFAPIQKIIVTLGVRSGLLAESFPQSLYQMSVRNGLQMSFYEFLGNCGSPVCINLAKDLPLLKGLSVGSQERINLSVQVIYYNLKEYETQFDVVLLTGDEGILELQSGAARIMSSLVTSKDVVESAIETGDVDTMKVDNDESVGGGGNIGRNVKHYTSNIQHIGRKAHELYNRYKEPIHEAAKYVAPTIAALARQYLAAGYSHEEAMRKAKKAHKGKGLSKGKGLVAGSQIRGNDRRLTSGLDGRD